MVSGGRRWLVVGVRWSQGWLVVTDGGCWWLVVVAGGRW